jgi:hypothetical protein
MKLGAVTPDVVEARKVVVSTANDGKGDVKREGVLDDDAAMLALFDEALEHAEKL